MAQKGDSAPPLAPHTCAPCKGCGIENEHFEGTPPTLFAYDGKNHWCRTCFFSTGPGKTWPRPAQHWMKGAA